MSSVRHALFAIAIATPLAGCGLFVPDAHQFYEAKTNDVDFVNMIFASIRCQIRNGVQDIVAPEGEGRRPNPNVQWLRGWGTKVNLQFTTEEQSSLNPGAAFTPPPPFSWSLGFGGSATATRNEAVEFTYAFSDLLALPKQNCENVNGIQIQNDLRIGDWIYKQVELASIPGTLPGRSAIDASSYTITFVASYNAGGTPTWTFKNVTVNPAGPFFNVSRSKTSVLVLTLAALDPATKEGGPVKLDPQGVIAHNAQVFGQAVGAANQALRR